MFPCVVTFLFLLLAGAPAAAAPASRVGEAAVRERDKGVPCFTIAEREEQRGTAYFQGVTVYDVSARPRVKIWAMAMPPNRTFSVMSSMCVPYGGGVRSLPHTVAATLQPGKVYEVLIDVRRDGEHDWPLSYNARFCLAKLRNGGTAVRLAGTAALEDPKEDGCGVSK